MRALVLLVLCAGCAAQRPALPNTDFLTGDAPSFFNDPKNSDNMGKLLTEPVQPVAASKK